MKNEIKVKVVIAPQTPQPAPAIKDGYFFTPGQWYMFGDKSGVFRELSPGKTLMIGKMSGPVMFDTGIFKNAVFTSRFPVTVSFHFEELVDVDA